MQVYGKVMHDLYGQDSEVDRAEQALRMKSQALQGAERQLDDVRRTLEALRDQYSECGELKASLAADATKLDSHRPPPALSISLATACTTAQWLEEWVDIHGSTM